MQALQCSLFERLIRERQSRLKGMRASACPMQSSAIDFYPCVDIDINGSQQPYAEAGDPHRIVSCFTVFISPSVDFVSRQIQRGSATWQNRCSHEVVSLALVCESEPTLRYFNSAA